MKSQSTYLESINTNFLFLLTAHVPVMCGVAWYFGTGVKLAAILSLLFLAGPALLYRTDRGGKLTAVSLGASSMGFSALLIHLSGGMVEMHFHIFTMLALMIAFRFPWPLGVAAATIAVHHIAFFLWLPRSVFNYEATFGVVLVHAFFVVFEVVPALWLTHLLADSADSSERTQHELKTMAGNVREVIREIAGTVDTLTTNCAGLYQNSGAMSASSRDALGKAEVVAASADRMNAVASVVAAGMDQTAVRLEDVASATEQMTATIGEIAGNSEKARRITSDANHRATQVTVQMNQLSHAVQEIGKITEAITEISAQTNLLALNATIEAARAGAAGKGFSVVANEIKALAHQTSSATEDIKSRIEGLRSSAALGIDEIGRIGAVIEEVSEIVSTIAAAIEEQAAVTLGIARNIVDASSQVKDANEKVSQTSQVSGKIARDIAGVNRISCEMASNSEQVLASSDELSKVAEQLRSGVSRFRAFCDSYDNMVAATEG
jgi:methyl-accepting chemotaxis protein